MTYAPLHVHCHYSIDGVGLVSQYVRSAIEKGCYGLGITDHGNCSSALELYQEGKKQDFPVVLGEEFYVVDELVDKDEYYHITVWVKNAIGYQNLCQLSSQSYARPNFYKRPRITYKMLVEHGEGLIVGSGCFIGEIPNKMLRNEFEEAKTLAKFLKKSFKDDFYLELMPAMVRYDEKQAKRMGRSDLFAMGHNMQLTENMHIRDLADELDIPYICSSDAHMPGLEFQTAQHVKMMNRSKDWEYDYIYYMRDPEDFRQQWTNEFGLSEQDFDFGCYQTREIVDKCKDLRLKFGLQLPTIDYGRFPVQAENRKKMVSKLITYHNKIDRQNPVYVDRLKREVSVLADNGVIDMLDYFLLLEDVCRFCHDNNIALGIGRGSAGGSLLAYALNITDVDPIRFNLSFERFMNRARIDKGTLPDIDTDISQKDRQRVIRYIHETYGEDKVALFGTIHTLKFKLALRDTIRILDPGKTKDEIDRLISSIPWVEGEKNDDVDKILAAISTSDTLVKYFAEHPKVKDAAMMSLGQMRQYSVHAAAIAISSEPVRNFVPLAKKANDEFFYTQYPMDYCAKAGLVKYDMLGLQTLDDIWGCLKLIQEKTGKWIHPWRDIKLDEPRTMATLNVGKTASIFQFNTDVFVDLLQKAKVETFEDLVAINTLARPGTMDSGMHLVWVARRKGGAYSQIHHSLKEALSNTFGIILYQEQVMEALRILADFTLEEADDIRKAIGKKQADVIERYGKEFVKRVPEKWNDIDEVKAKDIWDKIETFGRYSFNRSHSVAYAYIAYVSAWLKVHHPLEWWCSIFRNEGDDEQRRRFYSSAKPFIADFDINKSSDEYTIDYEAKGSLFYPPMNEETQKLKWKPFLGQIRPPLQSIKNVGAAACKEIAAKRPFTSFDDFYARVNKVSLKKNVVINLIVCGMFKELEPNKTETQLIEHYFMEHRGAHIKKDGNPNKELIEYQNDWATMLPGDFQKMAMTLLPFNTIKLNAMAPGVSEDEFKPYSELTKYSVGSKWPVVGLVLGISQRKTKKGDAYFFADLTNDGEKISIICFPEVADKFREVFRKNKIVLSMVRIGFNKKSNQKTIELVHAKEIG